MSKKKFINNPETITDEVLEGVALSMGEFVEVHGHVVMRKGLLEDEPKVVPMTLGGSGHEPSGLGFTGKGWENLKVIGDIFAAPGPQTVLEGIRYAHQASAGKGIFFYCGNHAGDVMSAKMAIKMAKKEGIPVELFIMRDDCSAFGRDEIDQRRNLCCAPTMGKMLGSASQADYTVEQMKALCEKYTENVASLAVANRGASHPVTDQMISEIPEGQMVIGMGHHGEGAKGSMDMATSQETVEIMASRIFDDIGLKEGDEVIVTLNGSGATTYMELLIVYKDIVKFLEARGVKVYDHIVGSYITTQEQAGFIMSMVRVDEEMKSLFSAPCRTAFVTKL